MQFQIPNSRFQNSKTILKSKRKRMSLRGAQNSSESDVAIPCSQIQRLRQSPITEIASQTNRFAMTPCPRFSASPCPVLSAHAPVHPFAHAPMLPLAPSQNRVPVSPRPRVWSYPPMHPCSPSPHRTRRVQPSRTGRLSAALDEVTEPH